MAAPLYYLRHVGTRPDGGPDGEPVRCWHCARKDDTPVYQDDEVYGYLPTCGSCHTEIVGLRHRYTRYGGNDWGVVNG